jgi:hypothetical protein
MIRCFLCKKLKEQSEIVGRLPVGITDGGAVCNECAVKGNNSYVILPLGRV